MFKALEQRDKDKEIARLQWEAAEAQHAGGLAAKEAKRVRQQLGRLQEDVAREREEAAAKLSTSLQPLAREGQEARAAQKKVGGLLLSAAEVQRKVRHGK